MTQAKGRMIGAMFLLLAGIGWQVQPLCAETAMGLAVTGVQTVLLDSKVGKNQIQFVSSAPMEEIHGSASQISGHVILDPGNLEATTGQIEVAVAGMATGIQKRDEHLLSPDWLDQAQFPVIIFVIQGLADVSVTGNSEKADIQATALGEFTLHGVKRPIRIPVEMTYLLSSEKTRKRAPGDFLVVKGKFELVLKDFEISGVRGMVGSRVGAEIGLEATLFGSTALAGAGE